jgi:peptidoglycan/LPS O-acetylase OafA/YrhL
MANTIATRFHGRDNNFNLIRFVAASAVLLDHCYALVAPEQSAAALLDIGALHIGRLAVDVFFIVSGFLVTRSVLRQPTLVDYAVARVLRLFPALLVATIFIAFVLGPLVTAVFWHDYFTDPRTWLFVPLTASLITHSMTLPGVFETVPQAGVIDPPLWTLRYEVMCYGALGVFALAGLFATRFRAAFTLAAVFGIYLFVTFATSWRDESTVIDSASRFVLGFFLGGGLYLFADKVRLDLRIALAVAAVAAATYGTGVYEAAFRLALAYALIWFALVSAGPIRRFNLLGDYSYGIYILCYPIQQSLVMLDPQIAPGSLLFFSFPAVLVLAILSWHFMEHPALRRKARAGDCVGSLLHGMRSRLATPMRPASAPKPQSSASTP